MVELTPLPLIITANAAVGKRWANLAAEVLGGVIGGLICLLGTADLAGARVLSPAPNVDMQRALDLTVMATGLLAAAVASWPVRSRIARVLPIDSQSPVQALALSLSVILFGVDIASISFTDVLASANAQPPLSLGDLVLDQMPFLILALLGVGLFSRRQLSDSLDRLGLVGPSWWHLAIALAAAGAFFGFSQQMDSLSHATTPHPVRAVHRHPGGARPRPRAWPGQEIHEHHRSVCLPHQLQLVGWHRYRRCSRERGHRGRGVADRRVGLRGLEAPPQRRSLRRRLTDWLVRLPAQG